MAKRKHYTRPAFAAALMRWVEGSPYSILDPAVGAGALLEAAHARWPTAELFGIDLSADPLKQAQKKLPAATLIHADALQTPWQSSRTMHTLIVCNPPFSGQSQQTPADRLEIQFVERTLTSVTNGDMILFVLPQSVAANATFSSLRAMWLRRNRLVTAISLPENAFENTEASAVGVILTPADSTGANLVNFVVLGRNAQVVHRVRERIETGSFRFDPLYYVRQRWVPSIRTETVPLSRVVEDVRRGVFVREFSENGPSHRQFIHSTDLKTGWITDHCKRFVGREIRANVNPGCVLLSRVGEGLWRKSAMYNQPSDATASDCVYIIRTSSILQSAYLAATLTSRFVQASIRTVVRGITAPILNKRELLALRVPWLPRGQRNRIGQLWIGARTASERFRLTEELNIRLNRF